jgi:hypothetical protein
MARLQVAGEETASNMEGSCEYIDDSAADTRKGVVLQLGVRLGVNMSSPE